MSELPKIAQSKSVVRDPGFFIVGPPRSGTTLLSALLSTSPDVSVMVDTVIFVRFWRLVDAIRRIQDAGGASTTEGASKAVIELPDFNEPVSYEQANWFLAILTDGYYSVARKLDPTKDVARQSIYGDKLRPDEILPLVRQGMDWRQLCAHVLHQLSDDNARLLGEKTPGHVEHLDWLLNEAYPDKKVISLVRHPISNIAAIYRRHNRKNRIGLTDKRLKINTARYLRDMTRIIDAVDDDRVMVVRYEDILRSPLECTNSLLSFVGAKEVSSVSAFRCDHFPAYIGTSIDPTRDQYLFNFLKWPQRSYVWRQTKDVASQFGYKAQDGAGAAPNHR